MCNSSQLVIISCILFFSMNCHEWSIWSASWRFAKLSIRSMWVLVDWWTGGISSYKRNSLQSHMTENSSRKQWKEQRSPMFTQNELTVRLTNMPFCFVTRGFFHLCIIIMPSYLYNYRCKSLQITFLQIRTFIRHDALDIHLEFKEMTA